VRKPCADGRATGRNWLTKGSRGPFGPASGSGSYVPVVASPHPRVPPPSTEADAPLLIDADAVGACPHRVFFSSPPGYPGDLPCPAKGTAIESHNDEDQSTLQRGTVGVREERYGEAELHRVAHNRD